SFGCRFPCAFCLSQRLYAELGQRVRFVHPETVLHDLEQRPEEEIYLTDLTFTYTPRKRLDALARELRERGISKRFTIDTRVDCITPAVADTLVDLNVERVKIGVEGITETLLKDFNKRTDLAKVERAVALLRERDIRVVTYLLIGGSATVEDYE